jgi:putative ABC transport system permease protein
MLRQDVRYAIRSVWRSKGLAVVAILCLGFGIGLNTTIFSIIDGVLLKPYPYAEPDRILVLGEKNQRAGDEAGLSWLNMKDWEEATSLFSSIAASSGRALTVSDGVTEPERHLGAAISWDLFPLLGVSPAFGRGFTADDDRPNAAGVVILSDMLWHRRYHADTGILGRSIFVNGKPHTVIGVMPPNFAFPENQRLWIPLEPTTTKDRRDARYLFAFGRMKPGVTPERAFGDASPGFSS